MPPTDTSRTREFRFTVALMLMHTYRDERAIERPRTDLIGDSIWSLILAFFALVALVGTLSDHGFDQVVAATIWVPLAVAVARYAHLRRYYRTCLEIRLGDDGSCELDTRRRTIRLHASQIRSVRRRYDDESEVESYVIRCEGGKLFVSGRIYGFQDFALRVKDVNPAIKLRGFPGL